MPALTKADMAEMLFEELGLNKRESKEIVEMFFGEISTALESNEQVKISFVWPDYIDKIVNYRPFFVKHVTEFHKDIMKDVLLNK